MMFLFIKAGHNHNKKTVFENTVSEARYSKGIEEEETDRRESKGRRCCLRDGLFSSMTALYRYSTRMTWRKGWIQVRTLGRMDASDKWMIICVSHLHAKPPLSQNGCSSSKNCSSNHPCWLVRHSSRFPKQQRWPLPFLLSVSSSMILRGWRLESYTWAADRWAARHPARGGTSQSIHRVHKHVVSSNDDDNRCRIVQCGAWVHGKSFFQFINEIW